MYCAANKPKNGKPHSSPPSVKKVTTGSCSDSQQGARFTSGRRLLVVSLIVSFSFLVWLHCVLRLGSYFLRIRSGSVLVIPYRHSFARPQYRFFECFFAISEEHGPMSRPRGEHVERLGVHLSK